MYVCIYIYIYIFVFFVFLCLSSQSLRLSISLPNFVKLGKAQNKGMQGVKARYDTALPPFISIVWHPGRPIILGMIFRGKKWLEVYFPRGGKSSIFPQAIKTPSSQALHFMGKTGHFDGKGKQVSRGNYPSEENFPLRNKSPNLDVYGKKQ